MICFRIATRCSLKGAFLPATSLDCRRTDCCSSQQDNWASHTSLRGSVQQSSPQTATLKVRSDKFKLYFEGDPNCQILFFAIPKNSERNWRCLAPKISADALWRTQPSVQRFLPHILMVLSVGWIWRVSDATPHSVASLSLGAATTSIKAGSTGIFVRMVPSGGEGGP